MSAGSFRQIWSAPLSHLSGVILLSVGLLLTQGAGAPGTLTVAVYPPWWGKMRAAAAVVATGAPIADFGPVRWTIVTVPETGATARALRAGGAILLLNGSAARLCGA